MKLLDRFEICGIVQDTRVIMPKKADSKWRQYIISVATLGKNFNLRTEDISLYQEVVIGQNVRCFGTFSFFNNVPQFDLAGIKPVDEKE